jgi:hypothetical protein
MKILTILFIPVANHVLQIMTETQLSVATHTMTDVVESVSTEVMEHTMTEVRNSDGIVRFHS